jgi:hypothetical protein
MPIIEGLMPVNTDALHLVGSLMNADQLDHSVNPRWQELLV